MRSLVFITFAVAAAVLTRGDLVEPSFLPDEAEIASLPGAAGAPVNPHRWFSFNNGTAQRTNWSNESITFDLTLPDSDPFRLVVVARNVSELGKPPGYKDFKVDAYLDGQRLGRLRIAADDEHWNADRLEFNAPSGTHQLALVWRNDKYRAGSYDANIGVGAVAVAQIVPEPHALFLLLACGAPLTLFQRLGYRRTHTVR